MVWLLGEKGHYIIGGIHALPAVEILYTQCEFPECGAWYTPSNDDKPEPPEVDFTNHSNIFGEKPSEVLRWFRNQILDK